MLDSGMIGLSNARHGLSADAIRYFTGSQWTHCFIVLPELNFEFSEKDRFILEAKKSVRTSLLNRDYIEDHDKDVRLYALAKTPENKRSEVLSSILDDFLNGNYGMAQNFFFVWRWFLQKLRLKTPNQNQLSNGTNCVELVWHYLDRLGNPYRGLLKNTTPNTISIFDIESFVEKNPDLFRLVLEKQA